MPTAKYAAETKGSSMREGYLPPLKEGDIVAVERGGCKHGSSRGAASASSPGSPPGATPIVGR